MMNTLSVIIPALLRTGEDQYLLGQTLKKVPWKDGDELILVTQGTKPLAEFLGAAPIVNWTHFDHPLTKWGAINVARDRISSADSRIVLMDADDPIRGDSLRHAWNRFTDDDFDLLIGKRHQISLRAADELSPRSRLYVELFSNALVFMRRGEFYSGGKAYPDIQSGFYGVGRKVFDSLDLKEIGAYGGELTLYHQVTGIRGRVKSVSIETRPSPVSNYDLKQIINDIFRLPFLKDADQDDVDAALSAAPLMYEHYLEPGEEVAYLAEMKTVLDFRIPW